jgi:peptidoglycan/xylan/chitin deacetylase (PgdA/CDA1 family)
MAEVLVLCYHGVSARWPAETTVTPTHFTEQLEALAERGWRGATLVEALTAPRHERTMAVTFDDAHRSVREHALPVMERLGMPGTIFVPTDYAGTDQAMGWAGYDEWMGTEHESELLCLDWDALRDLAARGWEIGSHTCSHPHLTGLPDELLSIELTRSKERCEEEMGTPCHSIAYPYSDVDDRVLRAARSAGYALGVTVALGAAQPLPLAWPRVGVYNGESSRRTLMRAWRRRHASADRAVGAALRAARELIASGRRVTGRLDGRA